MTSRFFDGFNHAFRGFYQLLKEEPHFRFQAIIAVFLCIMIVFLRLTYSEVIAIIIAIVLVLRSEAMNTVIERLMDSLHAERKKWIGGIKDIMASIVLINAVGALCIGIITLLHYAMRIAGVASLRGLDIATFFYLNALAGLTVMQDSLIIFFASTLAPILLLVLVVAISIACIPFSRKIYRLAVAIVSALVARFGITALIRFVYPTMRPFMAYEVHQLIAEQGSSFPSGHASFFFALSSAVFAWNKRMGIFFFVASLLMGISRVMAGVHYPSDIFAGMAVGIASAWIVTQMAKRLRKV